MGASSPQSLLAVVLPTGHGSLRCKVMGGGWEGRVGVVLWEELMGLGEAGGWGSQAQLPDFWLGLLRTGPRAEALMRAVWGLHLQGVQGAPGWGREMCPECSSQRGFAP